MTISTQKLLQLLDSIECDMRGLEGRLTSIRRQLYEGSALERSRIGMDGHPKQDRVASEFQETVR